MTLRYGQVQRSAMNWPFYVATELGLFAENGLVVEPTIFTSTRDPVAALTDGSLDVINVIPDVTLAAIENGAPLCIIANSNDRPQYRLMVQPGIRDFSDLKGHTVGVNDGRSGETLILRRIMRAKGLAPSSYELLACGPPPERCKTLKGGVIAGTLVTQPFDLMLEEEGFRVLASSAEVIPSYPFTVCVVRRQAALNEDVVSFLKCIKKAWQWMADSSHRQRSAATLSRFTNTTQKQAEGTYDLYLTSPSPPSLAPTLKGITTVLELLVEGGQFPAPIPPAEKYVDHRYVQQLG